MDRLPSTIATERTRRRFICSDEQGNVLIADPARPPLSSSLFVRELEARAHQQPTSQLATSEVDPGSPFVSPRSSLISLGRCGILLEVESTPLRLLPPRQHKLFQHFTAASRTSNGTCSDREVEHLSCQRKLSSHVESTLDHGEIPTGCPRTCSRDVGFAFSEDALYELCAACRRPGPLQTSFCGSGL